MPKRTQPSALVAMQPELKTSRRALPSLAALCSSGRDIWCCPTLAAAAAVDLKKADFVGGLRDDDAFTSTPIVPRVASRTAVDAYCGGGICPPSASDSGFCEPRQHCSGDSGLAQSPFSPSSSSAVVAVTASTSSADAGSEAGDGALGAECCRRDTGFSQQSLLSEDGDDGCDEAVACHDRDVDDGYGSLACSANLAAAAAEQHEHEQQPLLLMLPPSLPPSSMPCRRPNLARSSDAVTSTGHDTDVFLSKLDNFLGGIDPERVIGRLVGVERVDIVSELARRGGMPCCLELIARQLSADDKRRCCMVSSSWKAAFQSHLPSVPSGSNAHSDKENEACLSKKKSTAVDSNDGCLTSATRRACLATVQLSTEPSQRHHHQQEQQQAAPAGQLSCVPDAVPSLHQRFVEEAKSLRCGEKLAHCPRCRHPAKLNETTERGACTRVGCSFDYCTRCYADYHGANPCLMPQLMLARPLNPAKTAAIGSQRSKRNLRRL